MLMEEYRNFSKSQLQEMITLSPEQRQQVTAKTTVKQIREMKPKKQKPRFPVHLRHQPNNRVRMDCPAFR